MNQTINCVSGITVTNMDNSGVGSLRQAIADVCAGGTISFDASLSGGTLTLEIRIKRSAERCKPSRSCPAAGPLTVA